MGVYQLGVLLPYQQVKVLSYLASTYAIASTLSSEGKLTTITRDLTAPEQTALQSQLTSILASTDPAVYTAITIADLKTRLLSAYPALHNQTVAQIRTTVSTQIGGWASLANAKTDLQQWLPDLIAAVLVLILDGE